ncbi:vacuolar membrane PQ loop repeat protein [Reticulomyxa filosa]|uniref:Vacuolar membrane PQ loop repeat protein n=1 Tax=Reticulomyxa filosa TaxID=46433 RepID=X6M5G3_RETFI|nr:vacuolar membrane PQ loop repeat protein [Reticulomyxa filosa]|eukprot:ETO09159.1 vacuolar membrane PQ loop repeat protein [Reticulomyxa filosa]
MFNVNMNLSREARSELDYLMTDTSSHDYRRNNNNTHETRSRDGRKIMTQRLMPPGGHKGNGLLPPPSQSNWRAMSPSPGVELPPATLQDNNVGTGRGKGSLELAQAYWGLSGAAAEPVTNMETTISLSSKGNTNGIANSNSNSNSNINTNTNPNRTSQSHTRKKSVTATILSAATLWHSFSIYNANAKAVEDENATWQTLYSIGVVFGWLSASIYVTSRIPQVKLMLKTRQVRGLSPLFFCLTLAGNFTQAVSMLIVPDLYHTQSIFVEMLPWLISSSLCMFQDMFILFLVYLFRDQSPKDALLDDKQGVQEYIQLEVER